MDAIIIQILNGLDKGAAYALIALGLTLVFGTLGAIFRTGVYVYATTGKAPPAFGQDLVDSAFHPKG